MKYLLIILLMGSNPTVQEIEFDSKQACERSEKNIQSLVQQMPATIGGFCTPKGSSGAIITNDENGELIIKNDE